MLTTILLIVTLVIVIALYIHSGPQEQVTGSKVLTDYDKAVQIADAWVKSNTFYNIETQKNDTMYFINAELFPGTEHNRWWNVTYDISKGEERTDKVTVLMVDVMTGQVLTLNGGKVGLLLK